MNEEIITNRAEQSAIINPFPRQRDERTVAGAVEIESNRAIADVQGALVIAQKRPRDQNVSYERIRTACSRRTLAEEAVYSYPRAGQAVTGPSIRLAEVLAQCWGNLDFGTRELSRGKDFSEMEAYCWDLETNVRSSQRFTVRHWVDTRNGNGRATKDEREIYELTANMAARRLRARILAVIPPDIVDAAVAQCQATLSNNTSEPIADQIRKMVAGFSRYGVTVSHLEKWLGGKLDTILPEKVAELRTIFTSIKDGIGKASDFFGGAASAEIPDRKPDAPTAEPSKPDEISNEELFGGK